MAGKNKLRRFAENLTFDNLFQPYYESLVDGFPLQGKWHSDFFKNDNDIVLELGCGKGEYTIGLGEQNPNRNYIGIDIKGSRMYLGLKYARDHDLRNIAFIRTRINLIHMCFGPGEVSEIWITFPDPQARDTKAKKRLTSAWFLNSYSKFLKPGGIINVKTDNIIFYDSTLDVIEADGHELLFKTEDVYNEGFDNELTQSRPITKRNGSSTAQKSSTSNSD